MVVNQKIKVLIVDDSILIRKYLSDVISEDDNFELVGTASSGEEALKKILTLEPDVITLDMLMPGMNGVETIIKIMEEAPTRIILISSIARETDYNTILALEQGAVDFITKPKGFSENIKEVKNEIKTKIKNAMLVNLETLIKNKHKKSPKPIIQQIENKPQLEKSSITNKIVAIGCSTGGPNALKEMFANFSIDLSAAYVIVQHMPKAFTTLFAGRLNNISKLNVKEAEDGDILYSGWGYLAPGDSHIRIINKGGIPIIRLSQIEGKVSGHMPSIDVMFDSLSKSFAHKTVAVIMTGMGRDGADGITKIKHNGGLTIAQDEETSVIYGMNKEAVKTGCIDKIVPLYKMVEKINEFIKRV